MGKLDISINLAKVYYLLVTWNKMLDNKCTHNEKILQVFVYNQKTCIKIILEV